MRILRLLAVRRLLVWSCSSPADNKCKTGDGGPERRPDLPETKVRYG